MVCSYLVMKKIRKHTQLSLLNPKRAGRKPIHDKGIRHIQRERFERESSFHITIKVRQEKSDLQNKMILKALHRAIMKARYKSLKVIHYTLEFNHIHLLVEAYNQEQLSNCMQSFGVTLAKMINKVKFKKGRVYKHRYHLRRLSSVMELKNVLKYIFNNGIKHKNSNTIMIFITPRLWKRVFIYCIQSWHVQKIRGSSNCNFYCSTYWIREKFTLKD